ncbi:MAG TPA: SMP-30/gluconolactonase/LRE family protein [Blastocatellia bacterium]
MKSETVLPGRLLHADEPDCPFIVYSDEFLGVLGTDPHLDKVIDTDAHEGPVYVRRQNTLYFTTVPKNVSVPSPGYKTVAISKVDFNRTPIQVSEVRQPSNMANGMTLDREGHLLICEQGTKSSFARISRMNLDTGKVETVTDQWFGLRFNSPNDIVVKSDGTIWFTDPSYGFLQSFKPEPLVGDFVYRYDPRNGAISVVADSFNKPNGLAFSPDESILYINDSAAIQTPGSYFVNLPHHIRAFDLKDQAHLVNDRLFAVVTPGIPDGLKVDSAGRVYSSSADGLKVYSVSGDLIGAILVYNVANFAFGGPENDIIYILNDSAIYAAYIAAKGAISQPA